MTDITPNLLREVATYMAIGGDAALAQALRKEADRADDYHLGDYVTRKCAEALGVDWSTLTLSRQLHAISVVRKSLKEMGK